MVTGGFRTKQGMEFAEKGWDKVMNINVKGCVQIHMRLRKCLPLLNSFLFTRKFYL